jgi:hypothetical protein
MIFNNLSSGIHSLSLLVFLSFLRTYAAVYFAYTNYFGYSILLQPCITTVHAFLQANLFSYWKAYEQLRIYVEAIGFVTTCTSRPPVTLFWGPHSPFIVHRDPEPPSPSKERISVWCSGNTTSNTWCVWKTVEEGTRTYLHAKLVHPTYFRGNVQVIHASQSCLCSFALHLLTKNFSKTFQ